jgi:hypothetical protein
MVMLTSAGQDSWMPAPERAGQSSSPDSTTQTMGWSQAGLQVPGEASSKLEDNRINIPKTIWILWFQGIDKAPYVVRKCHESWVARNPGWRVVTLDDEVLPSLVSADYRAGNLAGLSLQHRSDLVRLDLLSRHGGVWADATCYCLQPLDDWLWPNLGSGFFAFSRPGRDRLLSNWFLAAEANNLLMTRMYERMLSYWGDHKLRDNRRQFSVRALTRLLRKSPRTRALWFSRPVTSGLAIAPYYVFHYRFEKLLREDPQCAAVWERTPKISAVPLHRLHQDGLLSPVSSTIRSEIDSQAVPLYKTAWNLKEQAIPSDSNLEYLLDALARAPSPGGASSACSSGERPAHANVTSSARFVTGGEYGGTHTAPHR